jgi:hypothetical protein
MRVVITTNFDRLIENAMRDAGVEPTIIASDDAVVGATLGGRRSKGVEDFRVAGLLAVSGQIPFRPIVLPGHIFQRRQTLNQTESDLPIRLGCPPLWRDPSRQGSRERQDYDEVTGRASNAGKSIMAQPPGRGFLATPDLHDTFLPRRPRQLLESSNKPRAPEPSLAAWLREKLGKPSSPMPHSSPSK